MYIAHSLFPCTYIVIYTSVFFLKFEVADPAFKHATPLLIKAFSYDFISYEGLESFMEGPSMCSKSLKFTSDALYIF